ncbi:hypothetical protein B0H66DRAFT_515399 [Apodospora peruviana]|uniref:Uncharacterized protein n=1 Tax=Apodospora peruviana TaxID=516989 RepID=A0AAE0M8G0_9PEZI|nr:hypothetical protein B0H66DRAFT_515399 [Apodospora peruviana]
MQTSSEYEVYLGQWINWSRGPVLGATLTMTRSNGNLLIGFLAFFVAVVGARFWRITALLLHFQNSTDQASDGLHHQRQAVLRNASNPDEGVITLLDLMLSWRGAASRPFRRLLLPLIVSSCCVAAFTLAGGFSSSVQFSDDLGSEVLLTGKNCAMSYFPDTGTTRDYEALYYPYLAKQKGSAANYASQCYTNNTGGILKCGTFVQQRLPVKANYEADCPFKGGLCKTNSSNIHLDTGYLDSHAHFGLNTPPEQRILFRKTLHCAPLFTEGHKQVFNVSRDKSYTRYYYGDSTDFNLTSRELYQRNYTYQYTNDLREHNPSQMSGYTMGVQAYFKGANNTPMTDESNFVPIPELDVPNANTYVVFRSGNSVRFAEKTDDLWYQATTPAGVRVNLNSAADDIKEYWMDEVASPLGCAEQIQFCNPNLPEDDEARCTPMTGVFDDEDYPELFKDPDAKVRFAYIVQAIGQPGLSGLLLNLGAQSLTSRYGVTQGLQGPMPGNQWKKDVEHWMSTIMTADQASFVSQATGPTDPAVKLFYRGPENESEQRLCQSQKILSNEYASFSILGLVLILAIGGLIVTISMSLEAVLACISRRLYGQMTYAQLEWCTNETLQLQRLVQEELGLGTWKNATGSVPITLPGEQLGLLDLRDREHPRICRPEAAKRDFTGHNDNDEKGVRYRLDGISIDDEEKFDLKTILSDSSGDWKI